MSSRPTSSRSSRGKLQTHDSDNIERLDYKPGGRLLVPDPADTARGRSEERSIAGSFFSEVAEGIAQQDRAKMKKQTMRYISFAWALFAALGAGGITAFSLYGPLFQQRLHYSQLQVNGVSITAELALYLPVPLWGALCDRVGPGIPSLISGVFFAVGYLLAAFAYKSGPPPGQGGDGWPYWVMAFAFIPIGTGTSCMYLSAVTTCAKNFGRGKYKGIALAMPIACFGLSGMWQSQVGSHFIYETNQDGSKGELDVHRYFLFLGIFLLAIGIGGFFALQIVDEADLIDEAMDELENSGLLEDSEVFQRLTSSRHLGYGTDSNGDRRLSVEEITELRRKAEEEEARQLEQKLRKTWLLNEETRRFLADSTMWWLAAGFFLVTGPGEAFINNMGTIIGTLYPPPDSLSGPSAMKQTSAATHVSIVAITSTLARILTGTLTDLIAPSSDPHQHRRGPNSLGNSLVSLPHSTSTERTGRFQLSRVVVLITFAIIMSIGQVILASGALQGHGDKFWLVSAFIGSGYGAAFSLTPICISVIWGVENFGTNWGVVATVPAIGATIWGLIYSWVYQWAAERRTATLDTPTDDILCYGAMCYAPTFWTMAICIWVACGFWIWAWRGPDGWYRRGIAV